MRPNRGTRDPRSRNAGSEELGLAALEPMELGSIGIWPSGVAWSTMCGRTCATWSAI